MIELIAEVTNSEVTDLNTCHDARDYIVDNKERDCPSDAYIFRSSKNYRGDPKESLGFKSCLAVTGFSNEFWNERYSSSAYSCRLARSRISNYNFYYEAVANDQYGVLKQLMLDLL